VNDLVPEPAAPLDPLRLKRIAITLPGVTGIEVIGQTGSTHDDMRDRAQQGAEDCTFLVAEHQNTGRGRSGRAWNNQEQRDLLVSLVVRPSIPADRYPTLTFHLGLALVDALENLCPGKVQLKWPNDILLDGKKVAGLLAESSLPANGGQGFAVLSFGLNVNSEVAEMPAELQPLATTMMENIGEPLNRTRLLLRVIEAISRHREDMETGSVPVESWNAKAAWMGSDVQVEQGQTTLRGKMLGVNGEGALMLHIGDQTHTIRHGDLFRKV
jgi:BirA family biotin operon repressor/biotin-[acetyl-CoA-carboxylase] ligase